MTGDQNPTESMTGSMSLDGDVSKLEDFYGQWADEYDADLTSNGYGLPTSMVAALDLALAKVPSTRPKSEITVLDAGCGTGLVGQALFDAGWTNLTGIDLSHEMAAKAADRNVYRSIEGGVDLTVPVDAHLLHAADIVIIGGVFTVGHVPPEALAIMATLAKTGGLIIASTRPEYLESTDYLSVSEGLVADGSLALLAHMPDAPYTMDTTGDYWAYQVLT